MGLEKSRERVLCVMQDRLADIRRNFLEASPAQNPRGRVIDAMAARLTEGVDGATAMRIDMFLMDLVQIADVEPDNQVAGEKVRRSRGFTGLGMGVDDESMDSFLDEARERLETERASSSDAEV